MEAKNVSANQIKRAVPLLVGGLAVVALLFIPTPAREVVRLGTDSFETHYQLFGERSAREAVTIEKTISGVGVLAVAMSKSEAPGPLNVSVQDEQGAELANGVIVAESLQDDSFSWARLSKKLPAEADAVTVVLTSPESTAQNPVGVRFEADTNLLALGLEKRIPVWQQVPRWARANMPEARAVGTMIATAVLLIGSMVALSRLECWSPRWALCIGLAVLVGLAVWLRIPTAVAVDGVFGGDAFNYALKAQAWLQGDDPFAGQVRRGPLLAIFLFPAMAGLDVVTWGRVIGIVSAAAIVVLVVLVLRRLRMPLTLGLSAGLLVAVNRALWWESIHGLSNVLYTALIVATVYAFTFAARSRGQYLVGVFSGLTTLTRYEGVLVAAVMIPAVWLKHRFHWRVLKQTLLPASILIGLFFILWPFTGDIGIRPPSDITADEGLYLAYSLEDLQSNFKRLELFVGRHWVNVPLAGNQAALFVGGTLLGLALAVAGHRKNRLWQSLSAAAPVLITLVLLSGIAYGNAEHLKSISLGLTGLVGLGVGWAWYRWTNISTTVLIMLAAQVAVSVAILPKDRYFVQLVPFAAVGLALGLWAVSSQAKKWNRVLALMPLGVVIGLTLHHSLLTMPGLISEHNEKAASTVPNIEAARYLRTTTDTVAVSVEQFLVFQAYLPKDRVEIFRDGETAPEEQLDRLIKRGVDVVFDTTARPFFQAVHGLPEAFVVEQEFTSMHGDAIGRLYRLREH